jgi:tight adherence protein C
VPIALLTVAVTVFVFCIVALVSVMPSLRPSRAEQRILESAQNSAVPDQVEKSSSLAGRFLRGLHRLRVHVGLAESGGLRHQLEVAGLREPWHADVYLASRLVCPLMLLALATFLPNNAFFWAVVAMIVGYMLPDFWLGDAIRRRRERIRLSLPNALDLLVICVEAGLGLDQALQRVGSELSLSDSALSEELTQINLEQRAGKPRLDAWRAMSQRNKIQEVDSFVSMLAQSDKFGTPITQALTTFADGLRTKRRQQAEEMAAKTTIKLIFPLVLFIFPSIFIVLLGPAVLSLMRNLGGLLN